MHENTPAVPFDYFIVQQLKNICQMFPGDSNRQISDLKFKLVKAEQEVTALEQNVSWEEEWIRSIPNKMTIFSLNKSYFFAFQVTRLEGQVTRYKSAAENSEKVEDELKAEKRKLQREVEFSYCKNNKLPFITDYIYTYHNIQ